jgi:hypothetical protein
MDSTTNCVEKRFGDVFGNPKHIKIPKGDFGNPMSTKNVLKLSWAFDDKGKHMEVKLIVDLNCKNGYIVSWEANKCLDNPRLSIYMSSMIYGQRKMPNKFENVPNDSKNEIRNPQVNNNGSRRMAIDFQLQNQCMGKIKELLVWFTDPWGP